jgi:hypothetical protein
MKTKPNQKTTQSKLAIQLGVSRQLIAAHIKKGDAPGLDDLIGWNVYLAQKGRIGSAPDDLRRAIAQERLEILKETKAKLARENQVETGKLIVFSDARRQCAAAWCFVFDQLQRGENELPPALAGLSCIQVYERLHAFTERLRKDAKEKFEKIGT